MRTSNDDLAWEVELDRLDLEIMQVERLIKAMKPLESPDWVPPTLDGPLPEHLLPRALDIQERQSKALAQILRALRGAQRQRRYVERTVSEEQLVPLYVDISA